MCTAVEPFLSSVLWRILLCYRSLFLFVGGFGSQCLSLSSFVLFQLGVERAGSTL
jgi:hypothetical protein